MKSLKKIFYQYILLLLCINFISSQVYEAAINGKVSVSSFLAPHSEFLSSLRKEVPRKLWEKFNEYSRFIPGLYAAFQEAGERLSRGEKNFKITAHAPDDDFTMHFSLKPEGVYVDCTYYFSHNDSTINKDDFLFIPNPEGDIKNRDQELELAKNIVKNMTRVLNQFSEVDASKWLEDVLYNILKLYHEDEIKFVDFKKHPYRKKIQFDMQLQSTGLKYVLWVIDDEIGVNIQKEFIVNNVFLPLFLQERIAARFKKVGILGKVSDVSKAGKKGLSFAHFEFLDLPYLPGIIMYPEFVSQIETELEEAAESIMSYFQEEDRFMIRSSPILSMPGRLRSVECLKEKSEVKKGLVEVCVSWNSPAARTYRRTNAIPDHLGMAIIVQKKGRGDLNNNSGSGVFSTRNPNTGENELFGNYLIQAMGEELMTGGKVGIDIAQLEKKFPECYAQIQEAAKKLEAYLGYPQEVEFVIEDGKLYFLQTRDIQFTPQAEIAYLQHQESEGILTEFQIVQRLEALQDKLNGRMLYKVKDAVQAKVLFRGLASTPGAIQAKAIFDPEKAETLAASKEPIIFVSTPENREAVLDIIFNFPYAGLITNYGSISSHESVLTRGAGIPSIINIQNAKIEDNKILYEGGFIKEGDEIVLDGDHDQVFVVHENVLEENTIVQDASYGICILEHRKNFLEPYLTRKGRIKKKYSYERLIVLNIEAKKKYDQLRKYGDKRGAFIANLEKHFLHSLLIQVAQAQGKNSLDVRKDLHTFELSSNELLVTNIRTIEIDIAI